MNELLLGMLSARTGGNGNPAIADMLARMRSSPEGGAQLPEDLLAKLGNGNPTVAMLAKHLAEARESNSARRAVIDVQAEREVADSAESDVAMNELREQAESMFAELSSLRERLDLLASALGACCFCWGQDSQCRNCRGRGRPGFSIPDEGLFEEFALPAFRTLRAQKGKSGTFLAHSSGAVQK